MNGSDLIVAAPWILFGIGLLILCFRLLRPRRSRRSRRSRNDQPSQPRKHDEPTRT